MVLVPPHFDENDGFFHGPQDELSHTDILSKIGMPDELDLLWDVKFVAENMAQNNAEYLLTHTNPPPLPDNIKLPTKSVPRIEHEFPTWLIQGVYEMIPPHLKTISSLVSIKHYNCVVLPDEQGIGIPIPWDQFVSSEKLQTRKDFFIGSTNFDGSGIGLIPMPPPCVTSFNNEEEALRAIRLYHIHVFLHEFFHTLINVPSQDGRTLESDPIRYTEELKKKEIHIGNKIFSLNEWYDKYLDTCISAFIGTPAGPWIPSHYASHYREALGDSTSPEFSLAVAEHMCETFVAYILNTVPNTDGWTNFHRDCCHQPAYRMMHELCNTITRLPEYSEELDMAMTILDIQVPEFAAKNLLYPGCGRDNTPLRSKALAGTLCTFVDPSDDSFEVLSDSIQGTSHRFLHEKLEETIGNHPPEGYDIIIMENCHGGQPLTDAVISLLSDGGMIIAQGQDWLYDFERFLNHPELRLFGVIANGKINIDDLCDYTFKIETEELRSKYKKNARWYIFQKK